MAALADVVRRLVDLTVTCDVPADEVQSIVHELQASADRLAQHVPTPPHARYLVAPAPAGSDPGSRRSGGATCRPVSCYPLPPTATANTCSDGTRAAGTGALTSGRITVWMVFVDSSATVARNTNTGWLSLPVGRLR